MANDKSTPASTPENFIMVDANTLAQTIAAAIAQAMAAQSTAQAGNQADLGTTIGAAVASGIAQTTRRKVTNGEYEQRGRINSYHPKGKAETPTLKRQVWQNDTLLQQSTLFDREIDLFNRITHSGRYMDRKVEVIFTEDDVYIRYNNKTADQRFELKNHFRSLIELLEKVVKDQEAEDKEAKETAEYQLAEKQLRQAAKERHFGRGQATKDAVEKAAQ
jgi:hypothetical protein